MGRYDAVAKFIRQTREAKSLGSTRALAKRAGVSHSYVATLERGEVRPGWATARRLMRALDLNPQEAEEFTRLWTAAGTPAPAREVAAGPAVPGLVIWRHLPELLYRIEHSVTGVAPTNPDSVIRSLVPAACGMLSYLALTSPPDDDAIKTLVGTARAALEDRRRADAAGEISRIFGPSYWVSARLLTAWHSVLFERRRNALRTASLLSSWRFDSGLSTKGHLTLTAREPSSADSVVRVDSDSIASVHEALCLSKLFQIVQRDVPELAGESADLSCCPAVLTEKFMIDPLLDHASLARTMRAALATAPPDWRKQLPTVPEALLWAFECDLWAARIAFAEFALRVERDPLVAKWLFGDAWRITLVQLRASLPLARDIMLECDPFKPAHTVTM